MIVVEVVAFAWSDRECPSDAGIAAYYRASDKKQEKSLLEQREDVIAYAARHGYCIVAENTEKQQ